MKMFAATYIEKYFQQHLSIERNVATNTISSYSTAFLLLLNFVSKRISRMPHKLLLTEINQELILHFLTYLEIERGSSIATRNSRLAAIKGFFQYLSYSEPKISEQCRQILAIQAKKEQKNEVIYLRACESSLLLEQMDRSNWFGRRDYAIVFIALNTGLRISELTSLKVSDLILSEKAFLTIVGKGRKERTIPLLDDTKEIILDWLKYRIEPNDGSFFTSRKGTKLSSDSVQRIVKKYSKLAALSKNVSPHTLRHSRAMSWRSAGVGIVSLAILLGHEDINTTMVYMHADLDMKRREMAKAGLMDIRFAQFKSQDTLTDFLKNLSRS